MGKSSGVLFLTHGLGLALPSSAQFRTPVRLYDGQIPQHQLDSNKHHNSSQSDNSNNKQWKCQLKVMYCSLSSTL